MHIQLNLLENIPPCCQLNPFQRPHNILPKTSLNKTKKLIKRTLRRLDKTNNNPLIKTIKRHARWNVK